MDLLVVTYSLAMLLNYCYDVVFIFLYSSCETALGEPRFNPLEPVAGRINCYALSWSLYIQGKESCNSSRLSEWLYFMGSREEGRGERERQRVMYRGEIGRKERKRER